MIPKNLVCLWYEAGAEEAARFYAETFPDTRVTAVHRAQFCGDYDDVKIDIATIEAARKG